MKAERPVSNRRQWLAAATGIALAGAGIGLILHSRQQRTNELSQIEQALWSQSFVRTDGTSLSMSTFLAKPLLLNFWATWCPPCIAELPLLDDFFEKNKANGWQVLGLAVDQPDSVRTFLQRSPVSFPTALAGFPGIELSRSLGNISGGLPFTVVLDGSGRAIHRKIGRVTERDLRAWLDLTS